MAIEFRVRADTTDVEQKLKSLPAKAGAAGREVGAAYEKGVKQAVSGAIPQKKYKKDPVAEFAINEEKKARIAANKEENARAQLELDKYNEAKARAAKRAAEKEQKEKEKVYAPKTGGKNLLQNFLKEEHAASVAIGTYLGSRLVDAAVSFGEALNNSIRQAGGLSRELAMNAKQWREASVASSETGTRAEIQAGGNELIQQQIDKYRNESTDQGALENVFDAFVKYSRAGHGIAQTMFTPLAVGRLLGAGNASTFQEDKAEAMASRTSTLEKLLSSSIDNAKKNQEEISSTLEKNPTAFGKLFSVYGAIGRENTFGTEIANLRRKNDELDTKDPEKLKEFQLNEAKIKGLIKYRDASRSMVDFERRQQESFLSPLSKREAIMKNIGKLQERLSGATNAERLDIEKQMQQLQSGLLQTGMAAAEQELGLSMMGAGGRREAWREMKREQRAINRQNRLNGFFDKDGKWHAPQGHEARAFTRQLMERNRNLELSQAAINAITKPMVEIDTTLKDRLRPTKL